MDFKPITTIYKGYKFRSRLEARWAVYFDALGMKWEYELEGYQFNGNYYLPDFYLPALGVFVEVKGKEYFNERSTAIIKLMSDFRNAGDGQAIMLAVGDPVDPFSMLFCYVAYPYEFIPDEIVDPIIGKNMLLITHTDNVDHAHYMTGKLFEPSTREIPKVISFLSQSEHLELEARAAALKARQAQFEHKGRGGDMV